MIDNKSRGDNMAYLTRSEGEAAIDKVKYWYQVLVQHGFLVRPFTSIRFTDSLNYLGRCQQSSRTGEFRLSLSSAAFHGFDLDSWPDPRRLDSLNERKLFKS